MQDTERLQRTEAEGGTAPLLGRKSEAAERAAAASKKGKNAAAGAERSKVDFSRSTKVFARMQEQREAAAAGQPVGAQQPAGQPAVAAAHLKL